MKFRFEELNLENIDLFDRIFLQKKNWLILHFVIKDFHKIFLIKK